MIKILIFGSLCRNILKTRVFVCVVFDQFIQAHDQKCFEVQFKVTDQKFVGNFG